jgi:hypothetical protein
MPTWQASGDCVFTSDNCVRSGTSTGSLSDSHYGNNERCELRAVNDLRVYTSWFSTESCCDEISRENGGGQWSGSDPGTLDGLMLNGGDALVWDTDVSFTSSGWELCGYPGFSDCSSCVPNYYSAPIGMSGCSSCGDGGGPSGGGFYFPPYIAPVLIMTLFVPFSVYAKIRARRTNQPMRAVVRQMTRGRLNHMLGAYAQRPPVAQAQTVANPIAQVAPAVPVAPMASGGTGSITDQLQQLSHLKNQGILSDAQFEAGKARILGTQPQQALTSQYVVPMAQPVVAQAVPADTTVVHQGIAL